MDKIGVTVRYVVAGLGAALVGFGFANSDDVAQATTAIQSILGAVGFLGAFGVAIYKKVKGTA